MRKVTSLMAAIAMAAAMLGGCGRQGENANIKETEGGEKVPALQIYDGYEDLQGQDLGVIRLPEIIEKPQYERLYRFPDRRGGADIPNEKESALAVLRGCFKEGFDEGFVTESETGGGRTYLYSAPGDMSAVVQRGFPANICKGAYGDMLAPDRTLLGSYAPTDTDKTVELKNGSCTVGQLLDGMQERLDAEILPHTGGFEAFPIRIRNYRSADETTHADIEYGLSYRGIALEESSPMFTVERRAGYSVVTSYLPNSLSIVTTDKNDYLIFSAAFSEQYPLDEEIGELISLKGAVDLLVSELAENSRYEIDTVQLRYCCRVTAPTLTMTDEAEDQRILADYEELQTACYEPTWCFYYSENVINGVQRSALKVSAVTGEITIDR